MSKPEAIFFDMDGTLLPMDEELFINTYIAELAKKMAPYGVEPRQLAKAMWAGVGAMVKNDGSQTNEAVFWQTFDALTPGADHAALRPLTATFYHNEFHNARAATRANPLAAEAVRLARQKARLVVLATNPLFPLAAQQARMSWMGLSEADFDFVTAFEQQRFCKPNPAYYTAICRQFDLDPAGCLMIGNDETEDMQASQAAGLGQGYLITDCLKPGRDGYVWQGPRGSFSEMLEFLNRL